MQDYYIGNSDTIRNFQIITDRTNQKAAVNYTRKFIKEEVAYILGNDITYITKSSDEDIITAITTNLAHWSEKHDQNLCTNMLKFGKAFELYYLNANGKFSAKVLSPLEGYALTDENDNIALFMHFFKKRFYDKNTYMDLYLPNGIIEHYNCGISGTGLTLIGEDKHIFKNVPVSICTISEDAENDTIYSDIKLLQDSYEEVLSTIVSEIGDFRQAYLKMTNCDVEDEDLVKMKKLGILKIPTKDSDVDYLIKNINDTFIQNTLTTLEEKMYEIVSHINNNVSPSSNTSSLALRTRLISLESRCKLNGDAIVDCIKNRLKFLFEYLYIKEGFNYNYLDIKPQLTPYVPSDDTATAQIISQVGDRVSTETLIGRFSFIDNPKEEIAKIKKERSEMDSIDLDKIESV